MDQHIYNNITSHHKYNNNHHLHILYAWIEPKGKKKYNLIQAHWTNKEWTKYLALFSLIVWMITLLCALSAHRGWLLQTRQLHLLPLVLISLDESRPRHRRKHDCKIEINHDNFEFIFFYIKVTGDTVPCRKRCCTCRNKLKSRPPHSTGNTRHHRFRLSSTILCCNSLDTPRIRHKSR